MYLQTSTQEKKWNYHNYLQLGEATRCEIVEGELFMMSSPSWEHQDVSRNLELLLHHHVQAKKLGKIFDAPLDVVLNDENIVQPDIVFLAKENFRLLQKKQHGIMGVPDLVVEIISPASFYRDVHEKKEIYERFQIKEYWIVDPGNRTVEVFFLENGKYRLFAFAGGSGKVQSKILEGFEVDVLAIMPEDEFSM
jgi:Uma2 family endonuclease